MRPNRSTVSPAIPLTARSLAVALLAGGILLLACLLLAAAAATAQTAAVSPLDAVPEKMPFNIPYGAPITLARAEAAITAVQEEAARRGWMMNIAVVDSGANLVAFRRMDGAQLGSIAVAEHKARTSVKFRRPTHAIEDAMQKSDVRYLATVDDMIGARGGLPLVEDGKLIGAIGCSGGTGSQDETVCAVGAALIGH